VAGRKQLMPRFSLLFVQWNMTTGETTWDRPKVASENVPKVGLKKILEVPLVKDFFDLANTERLNRLV